MFRNKINNDINSSLRIRIQDEFPYGFSCSSGRQEEESFSGSFNEKESPAPCLTLLDIRFINYMYHLLHRNTSFKQLSTSTYT